MAKSGMKKEKSDSKALEFAFEAVMTEYKNIRETALSRDQYRANILNYSLVLLSGSVLALDFLVTSQLFFSFLIISMLLSALGLIYLFNTNLNAYLLLYEHTVLRQQVEEIIATAGVNDESKSKYRVLQWQEYYRRLTTERRKLDGVLNSLSSGLAGSLPLFGSFGSIAVFFFARSSGSLVLVDTILLIIALLFALVLSMATLHTAFSGLSLWAEVSKLQEGT